MRITKFFKSIYKAALDPGRDLYEKIFISFSLFSELIAIGALIGDVVFGENMGEIVAIGITVILVPIITYISVRKNHVKWAIRILVTGLVFILLPALFFYGGGIEGGGILWFIFTFLYAGLLMSGGFRVIVLTLIILLAGLCYITEYLHPELIHAHSREMFFVDSYISLVLVGILCFIMSWYQNRLFRDENARARKEAKRAEELTRSQNRFFSSMSHEIRTPINSILGLNELILRDPEASDEIIKDASGIQGAGKMLLQLINDILDFSKMEAGSMEIVPVDYRIGDVLSDIVNMIWLRASDKGLKLDVSVDPSVPSVLYGDEVRIKQIIVNLLNNAVKYTQSGSVELHIESETITADNVVLNISISDTGMGIKKEALPFLFDAFKRVDEEKNRHIEGTGLGLSIVRQLVELMDGTITVNSVYGEGSTFTVVLKQGISDKSAIGELNIHNQNSSRRMMYEAGFKAPDVSILIVDDNEMNLEVESKLLAATQMTIDKAMSGAEALEMTLRKHYDVILMDHLMPEMDGIECLKGLRVQAGGLNRATPVVVLTANAGSDNRDLYNRSGFDGYLVKPVSGEALENTLIRHISPEKLILVSRVMSMREDISTLSGYSGKQSVIITTSSVSDIPDSIVRKLHLNIIPAVIRTEEGVFKDGVQMSADELIRYIDSGRTAVSSSADEAAYTEFFATVLKKAHHVIHIALTSSMSADYRMASEAAKAFENVTVINSGCLSSASGILALIAYKLTQQNMPVEEMISELEVIKSRLRCSFVIDTTDYMFKKGLISPRVNMIARSLNIHPSITFRDDKALIGGMWAGKTERAYRKYIRKAFPIWCIPDPEVVFITYVDIPMDTLNWIKEELSRFANFEHVIFVQASAAISSNCGPGTFGILYFMRGNKGYNIGSLIEDMAEELKDDEEEYGDAVEYHSSGISKKMPDPVEVAYGSGVSTEEKWYDGIDGIDGKAAIANSGSEDAFRQVLKIFYDTISPKSNELDKYYSGEDWKNYTIKIHALKSSAKLIGALELSDAARLLEEAGKEENTGYIRDNHDAFMKSFRSFDGILAPVFKEENGSEESGTARPVADSNLMKSVYEGLKEAADNMDCDAIDGILDEMKEYDIPADEKEKYDAILQKAADYDYDAISELLGD
ncbi:MAG: DegV family EDD domain-containing protein [Lachnospiraceae bacterium]|nr:DegV family EDD domain-containing protein [Lachnospiraceae bacterium]